MLRTADQIGGASCGRYGLVVYTTDITLFLITMAK